ncbi:hypothetical protein OS242_10380 [Tumebacillus sp. DT12]|uniref:Transposase n=1 Tax=Tumebacillus lacus TaxID=2995335 RepID=A0ABT3X464_9BACL|nr:hypothetical protein [Tumebacillus lacus]MCX7570370.1 hypothetical protein [Tumebacillus lacus]
MAAWIDLTGQKFGKLTCLKYLGNQRWQVKCDCGEYAEVRSKSMKNGNTKSCGCLRKKKAIEVGTAHGKSRHAQTVRIVLEQAGETDLRTALVKTLNAMPNQFVAAEKLLIGWSTLRLWKRKLNIKRNGGRYA